MLKFARLLLPLVLLPSLVAAQDVIRHALPNGSNFPIPGRGRSAARQDDCVFKRYGAADCRS
jgi:hypothetical protein